MGVKATMLLSSEGDIAAALRRAMDTVPEGSEDEDIGDPLPFEVPYWEGQHPAIADDSYPLPFHPLGLAERTAEELLGFWYEGLPPSAGFDPGRVALEAFSGDS